MIKAEMKDKGIDTTIPLRIEQIICDMWAGGLFC